MRRLLPARCCRPPLSLCFSVALLLFAFWNLYVGTTKISATGRPGDAALPSVREDTISVLDSRQPQAPTHQACQGYDGIYHIAMGDIGGAAGTVFFQFVVGQILYAERHNLLPWVHLNNVSNVIYDPVVHGQGPGVHVNGLLVGRNATYVRRPNGHMKDLRPGPPDPKAPVRHEDLYFPGTGVWEHYFEPVSDFRPGDRSCRGKLYVTMDLYLITPGIHGFSDWAPKCWRYKYLPDYATKPHIPLTEWLEPQRAIAHRVVKQYIRFQPEIQQAATRVNPDCDSGHSWCLGLHIRQSDKAAGRRVLSTNEFLPFAQAFVHAGGQHIYLATDSHAVVKEIEQTWPEPVTSRVRTMGDDTVRSDNTTAVFEMGISHHRTNQEVLVEILALSNCQFMVHGLSAVSESSIWINKDFPLRSVNLEDPEHLTPAAFGALVHMTLQGAPKDVLPRPLRTDAWWNEESLSMRGNRTPTHKACDGFDGVLMISSVGKQAGAARAFFVSVLNQLLYAEQHNLKPWVHLRAPTAGLVYDPKSHNATPHTFEMMHGMAVSLARDQEDPKVFSPGRPGKRAPSLSPYTFRVKGNGIWESYFEPVSDFVPGDVSCRKKPLIEMEQQLVDPGLELYAKWSVRSWRYDGVPASLWNPTQATLQHWYEPMRRKASAIIKKYFLLKPFIVKRATYVNPSLPSQPCLGVHIRNIDKRGQHRRKVEIDQYVAYMKAFLRAGGRMIYLATDSRTVMQHLFNTYPDLTKAIHTQGRYVVRSSKGRAKEWSPHFIEDHHRVNSEALVETLALSKCSLLVHSFSTLSESAIYLNPVLHSNSVNLEDPIMSSSQFEAFAREHIRSVTKEYAADYPNPFSPLKELEIRTDRLDNATIIRRDQARTCRQHAIVYLVQKMHSSYGRDSYANLLRSLDLLRQNYLSFGKNADNTDIFFFHSGDFSENDLSELESHLGPNFVGSIRIVDISGSPYWSRPKQHTNDNPKDWYAWPLFSEGYRRMMHWYAIDIWQFFERWNMKSHCEYKYIFRLDEDSFIHSPIRYDIFDLMRSGNFSYGFRMCAYEMKVARRMWNWWSNRHKDFAPHRDLNLDMCGFYNNFFVADLDFFRRPDVKAFLRFIDRQGHIYRRRLGDLMIHSMAVFAFAPEERIHRFLDFTYEHSTVSKTDGCVQWGGIQAGFDDANSSATLGSFYNDQVVSRNCTVKNSFLGYADLSPRYSHLDSRAMSRLPLHTITAGAVELPGKGSLSG